MKVIEIVLTPAQAQEEILIKGIVASEIQCAIDKISGIRIVKKSIDARHGKVRVRMQIEVYIQEAVPQWNFTLNAPSLIKDKVAHIIGAGPAGLFAALRLLELGIRPVIIERGKDVRSRRRDLAEITRRFQVNPDSNYCFGEGGAGTYSDGKLYTRSGKRGDVNRILNILVKFGADSNILYEAHPHIGTNKLPGIITAMREYIISQGGEVKFECKLTDIYIENNSIRGIQINNKEDIKSDYLILATGHSARDIYELLHKNNIYIEAKPFAIGVRIEHPQLLIDQIQYKCKTRSEYLPPASYSVVDQQDGRGVFSFCMCPGGIIAPAATAPNEIVVNGWSPSKRNNFFANSGMVVSVGEDDFKPWNEKGPLAGLYFQQSVEQTAYTLGKGNLKAPAQRMIDFVENKPSSGIIESSYLPGTTNVLLEECLPTEITKRLRGAFQNFKKKMPAYYTNEAHLLGVESRTSSPVRIPRDKETLQHTHISGLYPCGEGAGYAGGIVSAAMDGEKVAEAIEKSIGGTRMVI